MYTHLRSPLRMSEAMPDFYLRRGFQNCGQDMELISMDIEH